jgi:hypothetical protein
MLAMKLLLLMAMCQWTVGKLDAVPGRKSCLRLGFTTDNNQPVLFIAGKTRNISVNARAILNANATS